MFIFSPFPFIFFRLTKKNFYRPFLTFPLSGAAGCILLELHPPCMYNEITYPYAKG